MAMPRYEPNLKEDKKSREISIQAIEAMLPFETFDDIKRHTFDKLCWLITCSQGKFNVRYWSEGAIEHYQSCARCAEWFKKPPPRPDHPHNRELQHEHVHEKKEIINRLLSGSPTDIRAVVKDVSVCIVSNAEHKRLGRIKKSGWDRYRYAGVNVYDLLDEAWFIQLDPAAIKEQQIELAARAIELARSGPFKEYDLSKMTLKICLDKIRGIQREFEPEYRSRRALSAAPANLEYGHVHRRLHLIERLLDGEPHKSVVADTFVCRVTKDELTELKKIKEVGWQRYCAAKIDVQRYDTEKQAWIDFIKDGAMAK